LRFFNEVDIYVSIAEKPPLVKKKKSKYRKEKVNKKTCSPHLKMSNFGQGVPMATA
jgi:hypothetical protein